MSNDNRRSVILISPTPGQPSCGALSRMAASGEGPRTDYVELARILDADVIDSHYLRERASPVARAVAEHAWNSAGQFVEVYSQRQHYRHIVVWGERTGLPLALLFKLTRSRRDLVLFSMWLSRPKRAPFLKSLRVDSHLRAIINYSSHQVQIAAHRLKVPREKLYFAPVSVDEQFWYPDGQQNDESLICSVGSEQRDYPTLLRAVRGLDLELEIAYGGKVPFDPRLGEVRRVGIPPNTRLHRQLNYRELRRLYSRSRFVVIPLLDVDFDAGDTAIAEAMAMGKAVIVTRTRGQGDLVRDGREGMFVPPGDHVALRAAIEHLINHPAEAEQMGRNGRALIEERHTLDTHLARLAAIVRGSEERAPNLSAADRSHTDVSRSAGHTAPGARSG